jgi:hypothetical protein
MWYPSDKPVQLVKHLHKVPEDKRIFPAMGSIKYDGVYAFALPDGRIFSRTGKQCTSLEHFEEKIRMANREAGYSGLVPHVLIFEVYVPGWPVNKISGAFRRKKEQFLGATLMVHDAIPYACFMAGSTTTSFKYRTQVAEGFAHRLGVPYVKQFDVHTEEEAYGFAELLIADGHEGLVLRDPSAGWVAGARNETCTKIKVEEVAKCEVIGIEGGVGKNEGVASVIVQFNEHQQVVAGGEYEARKRWYNFPDEILGKTATIEYMCCTPDGKMREPRLKGIK